LNTGWDTVRNIIQRTSLFTKPPVINTTVRLNPSPLISTSAQVVVVFSFYYFHIEPFSLAR
jgi:hypothetical protein